MTINLYHFNTFNGFTLIHTHVDDFSMNFGMNLEAPLVLTDETMRSKMTGIFGL